MQVLEEITAVAAGVEADLVLIAGDQFDTSSPAPAAEKMVYQTLLSLAEVAPVVMVAGNHDHPRRLEAVAPLLKLGRVTVVSSLLRPDEGGVERPLQGVRVGMIPFLSQRAIVTAADLMSLDSAQQGDKYAERMAAIVTALTADLSSDEVNLIVGHVMVHGGEVGGGERAAHTVFDYSIPAQTFPPELSYVALGHLHRHQRMPAAAPVWYSGSPLQLDFGEVDDRKGVLLIEAEPGLPAGVEFRPLDSGRRLRVVSGTLEQLEEAASDVADTDYVRVVLDEPARAGLADAVRAILPQAVDVVLEQSRRHRGERTRPSRSGRTHRQLFVEYLEEVDARDSRVVDLFDELVEEAHEA